MGAVHLFKHAPRIEEQHLIGAVALRLGPIEEPERAGQCYGEEHVRPDRDDDIDIAGLDQLLADRLLRPACIAG